MSGTWMGRRPSSPGGNSPSSLPGSLMTPMMTGASIDAYGDFYADPMIERIGAGFRVETKSCCRFFVIEMFGTFMLVLMGNFFFFRWFMSSVAFANENPGLNPLIELNCTDKLLVPGQMDCYGTIDSPLAGGTAPVPGRQLCILAGAAFALSSLAAPGATMNPSFCLAMSLGGARKWKFLLPSILGQYFGALSAIILGYFMTYPSLDAVAEKNHWPPGMRTAILEQMFGLTYPDAGVSNFMSSTAAVLNGVLIVALMAPMTLRNMGLHPFVQELAKGLAIGCFSTAFGSSGLGSSPNPAQWVAAASFVNHLGHKEVWARHDYYGLKVPFFAPTAGVILGTALAMLYACFLYWGQAPAGKQQRSE